MTEYTNAYARRTVATAGGAARPVDGPHLHGVVGGDGEGVSILVTADGGRERLQALLARQPRGVITVVDGAEQSQALIGHDLRWRAKPISMMVCRELGAIPEAALPAGLQCRPVAVAGAAAEDEIDLSAAIALAVIADPTAGEQSAAQMSGSFRAMRPRPRLGAAVDADGTVRATSGVRVTGPDASVFFVNTDPAWRRRGIGRAMTAIVLRTAYRSGATVASLNASDAGASIYRSLGFELAGTATQFFTVG